MPSEDFESRSTYRNSYRGLSKTLDQRKPRRLQESLVGGWSCTGASSTCTHRPRATLQWHRTSGGPFKQSLGDCSCCLCRGAVFPRPWREHQHFQAQNCRPSRSDVRPGNLHFFWSWLISQPHLPSASVLQHLLVNIYHVPATTHTGCRATYHASNVVFSTMI